LESEAFKTYRAYATGEKAPKSKATKKKTDSESSPKIKPSQASKGKRIKTSAKGDKPATTKLKGLTVLSEVALSEAEQMKLATKRSLKEFHISHAGGSGDGVDILSKGSSLESDLSELKQTNQFAEALSSILGIVDKYLASKVKDTVDVAVQLKSNKLREEAQTENQDFLNSLDSNMKIIIKEQVKAQTSKIMTKVEKYVTETLGAEVLVRSTNQPQTSYAVASSLSELELKKILIDKMEENNSIDRSDVQKNLYRALLEAYNSDKDLLLASKILSRTRKFVHYIRSRSLN
ncbi:hypothetical protein Tco_0029129, partial [Tanacetum coccineum]